MTMQVIQRIELTGSQASIEFTSIPQTFTDLLLVSSLRSDRGAGAVVEVTKLEFNGSTSGYSYRELVGDGSGVQSSSGSITRHGLIPAASATSNTFSNDQSYIPNYTGSTQKSFSSDTVMENNATTSYQDIVANLWTGTSAITSIKLLNVFSSNFVSGSSATLFGILKGSDGTTTVS